MVYMVSVRFRRGRAIPPVVNLALEFLIWLGSLACLIVLAYAMAMQTKDYYNSRRYQEVVKMETGLAVLMPCLMCVLLGPRCRCKSAYSCLRTIHFTLSIRYYVEIRRRNQARAIAAQHSGGQRSLQVVEVLAEDAQMPSELAVPMAARRTELDAETSRPLPSQAYPVEAPTRIPTVQSQPSTSTAGQTEESLVARHVKLEGKRQRLLELQQVEEEQEAIRQRLSVLQQGRMSAHRHELS